MSDLAFLVLEQPWDETANGTRRQTVRPFFEGLEKMHSNVSVYYSTFYNAAGLQAALDADLLRAREPRQVLFIGAHGSRRRVGDIRLDVLRNSLNARATDLKRVEGIIISSCNVFQAQGDLLDLLRQTNFRWAVSYSCTIGWFDSMLIELAILNALAEEKDTTYRRSQARLTTFFQQALSLLNRAHPLEWDGAGTVAEHLVIGLKPRIDSEPQLLLL